MRRSDETSISLTPILEYSIFGEGSHNFNQPEARKQCFLVSDWLKFGIVDNAPSVTKFISVSWLDRHITFANFEFLDEKTNPKSILFVDVLCSLISNLTISVDCSILIPKVQSSRLKSQTLANAKS